ncbi:ABC transporter permease [Gracilimonas sp.]|uniref:ABC transporter permease n=1 Tax=Gracilimonas sp. TaxID=1974203 RepID=UPI002870BB3C|nr:ABC transporter permease [Gracilimonas sp.]
MQQIFKSVSIALQNIRANLLHSVLSMLGIIIGVAALVAILSLGDGLEETGRQQIESTTSVQMLTVSPRRFNIVNDVRIPRDTVYSIGMAETRSIHELISALGNAELLAQSNRVVKYRDSSIAVTVSASLENLSAFREMELSGRFFNKQEVEEASQKMVLSHELAQKWGGDRESLLGKEMSLEGVPYEIIGITGTEVPGLQALIPFTTYREHVKNGNSPSLIIKSNKVEDVPIIKAEVESWMEKSYQEGAEAFIISTYEGRVEQLSQGILIFKLVMGAITGIAVLVGGIGIMNVLLISVTERTKEIGIRKAAGARKKDIVLQFLSESVTVSLVGSIMGWVVGVIGVFGIVKLINSFTDLTFHAALSTNTALFVLAVAILIGIIFGTYPAWKAANLTPVDAIRHE